MKCSKRVIAGLVAACMAVNVFGCSLDKNIRSITDNFMTGLIGRDVPNMRVLCLPASDADSFGRYIGNTNKDAAVGRILELASFELDQENSLIDKKNGEGNVRYIVSLPDYTSCIAQSPSDTDVFAVLLGNAGRVEVPIDIKLTNQDDSWYVSNPAEICEIFYGPIYEPGYGFAYSYSEAVSDVIWTQSEDGLTVEDVSSIEADIVLDRDYVASGKEIDLSYELFSSGELIAQGVPDDLSVQVRLGDTDIDLSYFPVGEYELVIYNCQTETSRAVINTELTENAFSNRSLYMFSNWVDTDANGGFYNVSSIQSVLTLNPQYLASGKSFSLTFDVEGPDGMSAEGLTAQFDGAGASCIFASDSELPTGTYTFVYYNNGERVASKSVLVTLNLDSNVYYDAPVDSGVVDEDQDDNAKVVIYVSNEVDKSIIRNYTDVPYTIVSPAINSYINVLDSALASGDDAPDMFVVDSNYVSAYAREGLSLPVNELGISYNELRYMYEYTYKLATDANGLIHGVAWEVTPCEVFYSYNVAGNVLGVTEPDEVQRYFESWDAFAGAAEAVNDVSGGSVKIVCGLSDIEDAYVDGRSNPWFVDDEIYVSDYISDYLDLVDLLENNGLTFNLKSWSTEWTGHMSDRRVLSYWGPLWLGDLFIKNTYSGDWGVVNPPTDYFTSGSWIFASEYCDMKASAAQIIRDITLNEDNLREMIEDGMLVNNINVMNECADNEDFEKSYLNDQNPYPVFAESAWRMNAHSIGYNDDAIEALFYETVDKYIDGVYSDHEEAFEAFVAAVGEADI